MKTVLMFLFITQGFGVDDSIQVVYDSHASAPRKRLAESIRAGR